MKGADMSEIILHHYPMSPYAEKVRLAFGLKGISWRSVHIPNIMPKPELMPLTGGYRRTPVMQVGADIFCDTLCILREVERRFPAPSLYPNGDKGVAHAATWWAEKSLFDTAVGIAFGEMGDKLPEAFDFSPALSRRNDKARAREVHEHFADRFIVAADDDFVR